MPKSDAQCRAWIRRPESRRRFPGIQPYTVYTPCPCSKGSQHGLFSCFDGPHIDDCFLRCFVYYHRYRVAVVYAACVALAMLIVCSDGAACRSLLWERRTNACKPHRRLSRGVLVIPCRLLQMLQQLGPTHPIHVPLAISLLGEDVLLRLCRVRLLEFSDQPFQVQSKRARCDTAEAVVALGCPFLVLDEEIFWP